MWTTKGYDIGCSSFRQRHSVWIDCSKGNHFILCIKNYLYYAMSTINYHKDFIHLFMNWHLFSDLLSSSSIRTTMLSNFEQVKAEAGNCDWFVLCYSLGISAVMVFSPLFSDCNHDLCLLFYSLGWCTYQLGIYWELKYQLGQKLGTKQRSSWMPVSWFQMKSWQLYFMNSPTGLVFSFTFL